MGGPGSGRRGGARIPKGQAGAGQFTIEGAIAITTAEAVEGVQKLDREVENLTGAVEKSSNAIDENTKEIDENTDSKKKNKDETGDLKDEQFELQIALQLSVSALNQMTGALLKVVGAMEQLNLVSEETAEKSRNVIAALEILVGVLEFILTLFLLVVTANYILNSSMVASAIGTGGLTVAMLGLGKAVAIILIQFAPLVIFLAAIAYGFKILFDTLRGNTEAIDAIDRQLGKLRDLLSDIVGLTSGLTSGIGALGDVVRDNPATKFLSKAGGSIF